jgi:competence protein ComEA
MWASSDKVWSVIPLPKKNGTEFLTNNPIALNEAEEDDLRQLPGIGPSKAKAILDYRDQNGPFESINDLAKVKGIGPKTVARLRPFLTLEKILETGDND